MKIVLFFTLVMLAAFTFGENREYKGSEKKFVNDICMPSTLYFLSDTQNDIFIQPVLKRWRPYNDFVRFSLSGKNASFMRSLSTVASINKPVDGSILTTTLVNGDEFSTVKSLNSTIKVGVKGKGNKEIIAQIIGDSYTNGGAFFRKVLLDENLVPKLKLVGLRKFADGQFDEGRGGWTLATYYSISTGATRSFNGFMQPEGQFKYYGDKSFWVNAWKVFRNTAGNSFEPRYSCGRFDEYLPRFNENTGELLSPKTGDMQFDGTIKSLLLFDGKNWVERKQSQYKWSFDYGKYLEMWQLPEPDFLFVMLGVNDFINQLNGDYTTWNTRITQLKNSYHKAVPKGIFAICIPCSTFGTLDNSAGAFTIKQNAALWNFRKNLIDNFDNKSSQGFHLIDTGIATDNDHGYSIQKPGPENLPFQHYTGKSAFHIQTGTPHPYANYPTMANSIAAFIQYHRKDK